MPARKPAVLQNWHQRKEEREARESAEAAMLPKTQISKTPPAALKGRKAAAATWRRLVGLFQETQGTIISAFDEDLLIKYSLALEEIQELQDLRKEVKFLWTNHLKILGKLKPKADQLNDYYSALGQANALLQRWQGIDARLDQKRKLVFALGQSLYLTPRSRSGVPIPEKEPEPDPEDDMEALLNED